MSRQDILISAHDLAQRLPGVTLLDASVDLAAPAFDGDYRVVSGKTAWHEAHIPGARHADLLDALADSSASFSFALPSAAHFAKGLSELGVDSTSPVVVYDRHDGFWAARLWWMLRSVGLAAQVLDGGFKAWRAAGLPERSGDEPAVGAAPVHELTLDRRYWSSQQDVAAVVEGRAKGVLICALSAALFDGSAVTRYARRGHIPGSLNRPARGLFDEKGRYLADAELAKALGAALLAGDEQLILYCGGGISAAATALALSVLGRDNLSIYDGSLQEWAADRALPMTTGATPA
ncbi:sulfurtransferase [Pseudomonas sp. LRF_L74]|uniref:sulfurtransferase n=1 Tax=Pseudomonas sp. LRF_L74 TaxID=3369422 RepID=UPI003F62B103